VLVQYSLPRKAFAALGAFERSVYGVNASLMQRASPIVAENLAAFRARKMTFTFVFIPFLVVFNMHIVHMLSQTLSVAVALATRRADVRFLCRVDSHVLFHIARVGTCLPAHFTRVDIIFVMYSLVLL
jgi:hypothetical protein